MGKESIQVRQLNPFQAYRYLQANLGPLAARYGLGSFFTPIPASNGSKKHEVLEQMQVTSYGDLKVDSLIFPQDIIQLGDSQISLDPEHLKDAVELAENQYDAMTDTGAIGPYLRSPLTYTSAVAGIKANAIIDILLNHSISEVKAPIAVMDWHMAAGSLMQPDTLFNKPKKQQELTINALRRVRDNRNHVHSAFAIAFIDPRLAGVSIYETIVDQGIINPQITDEELAFLVENNAFRYPAGFDLLQGRQSGLLIPSDENDIDTYAFIRREYANAIPPNQLKAILSAAFSEPQLRDIQKSDVVLWEERGRVAVPVEANLANSKRVFFGDF